MKRNSKRKIKTEQVNLCQSNNYMKLKCRKYDNNMNNKQILVKRKENIIKGVKNTYLAKTKRLSFLDFFSICSMVVARRL